LPKESYSRWFRMSPSLSTRSHTVPWLSVNGQMTSPEERRLACHSRRSCGWRCRRTRSAPRGLDRSRRRLIARYCPRFCLVSKGFRLARQLVLSADTANRYNRSRTSVYTAFTSASLIPPAKGYGVQGNVGRWIVPRLVRHRLHDSFRDGRDCPVVAEYGHRDRNTYAKPSKNGKPRRSDLVRQKGVGRAGRRRSP
jgi:hypothetical protein